MSTLKPERRKTRVENARRQYRQFSDEAIAEHVARYPATSEWGEAARDVQRERQACSQCGIIHPWDTSCYDELVEEAGR